MSNEKKHIPMDRPEWNSIAMFIKDGKPWRGYEKLELPRSDVFGFDDEQARSAIFRLLAEVDHLWSGDYNLRGQLLEDIQVNPRRWQDMTREQLFSLFQRLCANDSSGIVRDLGIKDWSDDLREEADRSQR